MKKKEYEPPKEILDNEEIQKAVFKLGMELSRKIQVDVVEDELIRDLDLYNKLREDDPEREEVMRRIKRELVAFIYLTAGLPLPLDLLWGDENE